MNKVDALILAGAGLLAGTAAVLWFAFGGGKPDGWIPLEDAPEVTQQMVAGSTDPDLRKAQEEGRQIRVRPLQPSDDMPRFERVRPGSSAPANDRPSDAEVAARLSRLERDGVLTPEQAAQIRSNTRLNNQAMAMGSAGLGSSEQAAAAARLASKDAAAAARSAGR